MFSGMPSRKIHDDELYENPVRAGLVAGPCDWAFSSTRYYERRRSVGVPIRWIARTPLGPDGPPIAELSGPPA
jgi:hypothetical protein